MCEKRFPYAKLNLMYEVNHKHLGYIEIPTQLLNKYILRCMM
jgi:hypothetical protein